MVAVVEIGRRREVFTIVPTGVFFTRSLISLTMGTSETGCTCAVITVRIDIVSVRATTSILTWLEHATSSFWQFGKESGGSTSA